MGKQADVINKREAEVSPLPTNKTGGGLLPTNESSYGTILRHDEAENSVPSNAVSRERRSHQPEPSAEYQRHQISTSQQQPHNIGSHISTAGDKGVPFGGNAYAMAAIHAPPISPRHPELMMALPPRKNPPSTTPSPPKQNRKRGVPHVYRDYSSIPDTAGYVRKKTGGVTQPFPEKLHELLERENEPTVIAWLPHGRAFLVRKPKEFTNYVMPKYFRQTKLTSFQRQLNLYGFRRITQGPDGGAYYHELFLRGRPQLCMRMQRQKVKGTGHKQPADAQTEPNFYSMPSSQALPSDSAAGTATTGLSVGGQTSQQPMVGDTSPGLAGVHGAAELLKNIAAGFPGSASPFSLGAPARASMEPASSSSRQSSPQRQDPNATSVHIFSSQPSTSSPAAVAIAPRVLPTILPSPSTGGSSSMSLLGRIASSPSPASPPAAPVVASSSPQQHSTFFWPPVRKTEVPPLPYVQDSAPSHTSIFDQRSASATIENVTTQSNSKPEQKASEKPGSEERPEKEPLANSTEVEASCAPVVMKESEESATTITKDPQDVLAAEVGDSQESSTDSSSPHGGATKKDLSSEKVERTPSDGDNRHCSEIHPTLEEEGNKMPKTTPADQPAQLSEAAHARYKKDDPPQSCAASTAASISNRRQTEV